LEKETGASLAKSRKRFADYDKETFFKGSFIEIHDRFAKSGKKNHLEILHLVRNEMMCGELVCFIATLL